MATIDIYKKIFQSDLDPSPEEMLLLFGETVHWSRGPLFVREDYPIAQAIRRPGIFSTLKTIHLR